MVEKKLECSRNKKVSINQVKVAAKYTKVKHFSVKKFVTFGTVLYSY